MAIIEGAGWRGCVGSGDAGIVLETLAAEWTAFAAGMRDSVRAEGPCTKPFGPGGGGGGERG